MAGARRIAALALFFLVSWPAFSDGAAPPEVRWRTLESEHFRIHFYEEERHLATRAVGIAERAYDLVTKLLNWKPGGRIDITLTDQTDSANGFANNVPYNYIVGFGAPPDNLSSLNDFDDWLDVLLTHELTHVVHLDITLGVSRALNAIFGKTVAPNQAQPNWFIEGLAVLHESYATTGGRLRNAMYDMMLRTALLEGRFLDLDAVSNGPRAYPQGTAPYLYGSAFLEYLRNRFGIPKIAEMSHRYGGTLIPLGLNRVARRTVGLDYEELWHDWKAAFGRRVALQVEEADRRGLTPARRLTFAGETGGGLGPAFFPDGTIAYLVANSYARSAFMRLDPATGVRTKIMDINAANSPAPTPDGRALVFSQVAFNPMHHRIAAASHADWEDLFRLDLESGAIQRLTHATRAHDPAVSPDGTTIACTVSRVGMIDLALVPIEGGEPRIVAHQGERDIAYTPAWSPDGKLIAYSRWKPGGYRDIHIYDVAAGTDRALAIDRALDADPVFSRDGRFVLFSSDRTGIYNVFAHELDSGRLFQVTNVLGSALQPIVAPDGRRLVFAGASAAGLDVYETAYDPPSWPLAAPFINHRPDPRAGATDADIATTAATATERPYQSWRYLYPRRWEIAVSSGAVGLGSDLTLATSLGDPASIHALGVRATVPTSGDASARVDYNYYGLWPNLGLSLARAAYMTGCLFVDGQCRAYREHALSGSAGAVLPILREPDRAADLYAAYTYIDYGMVGDLPAPNPDEGVIRPPQGGPNAYASLGWSYSNVQAWNFSVSGQEGRRVSVSLDVNDPALGSRFHTAQVGWYWTEFVTPPWAKLQAVGLSYSGGVGIGDRRGIFHIGGLYDQDLVRDFFLNRRQCCTYLRGYRAGSIEGDQFHVASLEYRAPLLWFEKGYSTFPIYFRRLTGALFFDAGNAFYGDLKLADLRYGAGGELRLEFKLGYYLESLLQAGLAQGFSRDGITKFYLASAFPF